MSKYLQDNLHRTKMLLSGQRLEEALHCLSEIAFSKGWADTKSDVDVLLDNYRRLLQYFENGTCDPSRNEQLDNIFIKAWSILDTMDDKTASQTDENLSDSITIKTIEAFMRTEQVGEARDISLGHLFNRIKMSFPLSREVRHSIHDLMLDEQLPMHERGVVLSAILLNMLQRFDANMLENVYTYTLDDQPLQIRIQAYVTLVLCGLEYDSRICHLYRLRELYRMIVETEGDLLAAMQITLIHCPAAKSFHDRFANVVKVELGKVRTGQAHMSFKEFLGLFNNGVDHDYEAFLRAFKEYPFFAQPDNEHHWLMPFSTEHYWVKALSKSHADAPRFITMMCSSVSQSNSTKYAHLNLVAKDIIKVLDQLQEQTKDIPIQLSDIAPLDGFTIMRNYLHDLYRYLTITEFGKTLNNPLENTPDFKDIHCLSEDEEDAERLEGICRVLYQQKSWSEARIRLIRLTQQRATPDLLDMLATAAENDGEFETAEEALLRYKSLYSFNEDNYLRLARMMDSSYKYISEEYLLHDALKLYPNHEALTLQMGICLNHQNRYNEAMTILSHVASVSESKLSLQVHQQLANACLAMRQGIEAEKHISICLNNREADTNTLVLSVIIALHNDDINQAIFRYRDLISITDIEKACMLMKQQEPLFRCSQTDTSALTLLNDLCRYRH